MPVQGRIDHPSVCGTRNHSRISMMSEPKIIVVVGLIPHRLLYSGYAEAWSGFPYCKHEPLSMRPPRAQTDDDTGGSSNFLQSEMSATSALCRTAKGAGPNMPV
ncbi:hypothetical protein MCOR27_004239 [Pyricularia oryzae]|uniref:Uncharacterized protein n=1 Tax=Pyricularia grisea TaxID=148305 RepID=A0ABQ8P0D0_PYRGI|nr:hypothetical protein MCOR01_000161 [Pyricularia oryzae]KAI6304743.1 hypothetical protein MCOR33_000261 [Pyricularia grisea]KAI6281369.1 hypothetical protein MCOR27_004239 [Pyricularia oryzae]KAI6287539.1 hypothetical protein MCOR26_000444 [Pyricularia oryzae]KAI6317234.1 hypothetical protein MCOR34_004043 [Pyricularia oryzae]